MFRRLSLAALKASNMNPHQQNITHELVADAGVNVSSAVFSLAHLRT
jgi:hypothetical protein